MSVIADFTGNVIKADGHISASNPKVTATGNAATITSYVSQITTPSLATAAGGNQPITITFNGITSANIADVSFAGGTNTVWGGVNATAVCTANTVTVTIYNGNAAALNGTVIFNLTVM